MQRIKSARKDCLQLMIIQKHQIVHLSFLDLQFLNTHSCKYYFLFGIKWNNMQRKNIDEGDFEHCGMLSVFS